MDERVGKRGSTGSDPDRVEGAKRPWLCSPVGDTVEKSSEETGSEGPLDESSPAEVDGECRPVVDFRNYAQNEASKAFPEIMEAMVNKAKEGSVSHTRELFSVAGVKEQHKERAKARDGKKRQRGQTFGEVIQQGLDKLKKVRSDQRDADAMKRDGPS